MNTEAERTVELICIGALLANMKGTIVDMNDIGGMHAHKLNTITSLMQSVLDDINTEMTDLPSL